MIRILHSVSNMDRGGIETMIMNYYRHIDRSQIQFDFLVNKPKPGDYDEEIRSMGGRIFLSPGLSPTAYPKYMKFMKELLSENPSIKVLHAHNEAMALYALRGAQKAGFPNRIANAHNTQIQKDYKWPLKIFCKAFIPLCATEYWGCGRDAGIYYFGKEKWEQKGKLFRNAIDLNKFAYHDDIRRRVRQKYNLDGKFVIGHVGRFNVQKNHTRLLDIFSRVCKIIPDSVLVLIGEGELQEKMKQKAVNLGIADRVMFLGLRRDVSDWYNAMDVFVMPSLFEGLPRVGIEAQASGVPCIFSDQVTDEVILSETSKRLNLRCSDEVWAKEIELFSHYNGNRERGAYILREAGYDIEMETLNLQKAYETLAKECKGDLSCLK